MGSSWVVGSPACLHRGERSSEPCLQLPSRSPLQPPRASLPSLQRAASGQSVLSVWRKQKPSRRVPGLPHTGQCNLSTYFSLWHWQLACMNYCSSVSPTWPAGAYPCNFSLDVDASQPLSRPPCCPGPRVLHGHWTCKALVGLSLQTPLRTPPSRSAPWSQREREQGTARVAPTALLTAVFSRDVAGIACVCAQIHIA